MTYDYFGRELSVEFINILNARFPNNAKDALDWYFSEFGRSIESSKQILTYFLQVLKDKNFDSEIPNFPKFIAPKDLLVNNLKVRKIVINEIKNILNSLNEGNGKIEDIENFLISNHESIKYALNQWLLSSPGMAIEPYRIPEDINPDFLEWLKEKFDVGPGALVLHRHVISNNRRIKLKEMGFEVPDMHWIESYYRKGMTYAQNMIRNNESISGIISIGSWVYNKANYEIATDGKPFVSFTFLDNDELTGHRFDIKPATEVTYTEQFNFATRDPRRKALYESGEFKPIVTGVFYPSREVSSVNFQNEI